MTGREIFERFRHLAYIGSPRDFPDTRVILTVREYYILAEFLGMTLEQANEAIKDGANFRVLGFPVTIS